MIEGTMPSHDPLAPIVGNVSPSLSSFVGRIAEIAEIEGLLDRCRLLTLTGPPGIGKSRLGLELTVGLSERYPDGVWQVELAPIADAALIPRALAAALSADEMAGVSVIDAVLAHLSRRRALLLLDNCEHLVSGCAQLVDSLLSGCPYLSIIATSREPLAIDGEKVWRVPALAAPAPDDALTPQTLMDYEAARLFAERAGAVQIAFELTAEHVGPIAEITRRLDGIPLAVELAAARVEALTPAEIAVRLDQRFALLTNGSRSRLPRHRTLQAAVDWSHDLLTEPERALLRRLSVFRGGFCLEACEVVCAGGEVEDAEVFHLLARLVAKSLVSANTANHRGRYRMLETIRAYAADRLQQSGDADAVREAHARFYLGLAEQAEPELAGPSQARWFERLDGEHANLRATVDWSLAHGHPEWAQRLTAALILFWRVRCRFTEGRELLEAVLATTDAGDAALRAKVRWGIGFMADMAGDAAGAHPALQESLARGRELRNSSVAARALLVLGNSNQYGGPPVRQPRLEESARLAREAGDAWCLAHALGAAGYVRLDSGEYPRARPWFEECLAVARAAGDLQGQRYGLYGLAGVVHGQGDHESAEALFTQVLTIARELGESMFQALTITALGKLAFDGGDYDRARGLFEEAQAVMPPAAPYGYVLGPLLGLGRVAHAQGDHHSAGEAFAEADRYYRPAALSLPALLYDGDLAADRGDAGRAHERFETVLERARATGQPRLAARALHGLGLLARDDGELKRAGLLHNEALGLQRTLQEATGVVASLEAIGGLAAVAGRYEDSARLLGAADGLRDRNGYARFPWESRRYEADLALGRDNLGRQAYQTAFAQGTRVSIDEAVAHACKGRKRQARPSTGLSSLTERERQVAALAAEGLTNPQIAERLFVSLATVKAHLRHVFAKVGVATRRELEAEIRRGASGGSPDGSDSAGA